MFWKPNWPGQFDQSDHWSELGPVWSRLWNRMDRQLDGWVVELACQFWAGIFYFSSFGFGLGALISLEVDFRLWSDVIVRKTNALKTKPAWPVWPMGPSISAWSGSIQALEPDRPTVGPLWIGRPNNNTLWLLLPSSPFDVRRKLSFVLKNSCKGIEPWTSWVEGMGCDQCESCLQNNVIDFKKFIIINM